MRRMIRNAIFWDPPRIIAFAQGILLIVAYFAQYVNSFFDVGGAGVVAEGEAQEGDAYLAVTSFYCIL